MKFSAEQRIRFGFSVAVFFLCLVAAGVMADAFGWRGPWIHWLIFAGSALALVLVAVAWFALKHYSEECRRAEAALRDLNTSLQTQVTRTAESVPGVLHAYKKRPDGSACFPYAGPGIQEIYGSQSSELAVDASRIWDLILPEDRAATERAARQSERDLSPLRHEFRIRHPQKGELWIEVHSRPQREPDGSTVWYGILSDITARKRVEEELRQQFDLVRKITAQLEAAQDLARMGSFTMDLRTGDGTWSRSLCRLMGRDASSPPTFQEFLDFVHPDDRERFIARNAQVEADGFPTFDFRTNPERGPIRHFTATFDLIRDDEGSPSVYTATILDIAQRKTAEAALRESEERMRQAQKMEAIGTLAGGIAHEFNNVIAGILGSAELVQMDLPPEHPARPFLQGIFTSSHRARDLVQQILAFSRRRESEKTLLKLQPLVAESTRLLRSTVPAMVKITQFVDPECPHVIADAAQIHQLIMTICTNALQALPEQGGQIDVSLYAETVTEEIAARHPDLRSGSYARLSISDNGHGMDAATLRRIFEPFFTTKPRGEGSGMGLAVAHGIARAHDGAILVESEPGKGSKFQIYIPTERVPTVETRAPSNASTASGNGERILLVDDEEILARVVQKALQRFGYVVSQFSQPQQALDAFVKSPRDFDLVITDLAMPGMSGQDLAAAMLRVRPELPVILLSGFIESPVLDAARSIGIRAVLDKPVALEILRDTIKRELNRPAALEAEKR